MFLIITALLKDLIPKLEFYDSLIERKLSENLSLSYLKALKAIARCLRKELVSKGHISSEYVDSCH